MTGPGPSPTFGPRPSRPPRGLPASAAGRTAPDPLNDPRAGGVVPRSRVVRDEQARRDPPTQQLRPGLDDPDPYTPLFDSLWALRGMSGRRVLNPDRRTSMARHHDHDGDMLADQADPDHVENPEQARLDNPQPWCEDRQPGVQITDQDEVE